MPHLENTEVGPDGLQAKSHSNVDTRVTGIRLSPERCPPQSPGILPPRRGALCSHLSSWSVAVSLVPMALRLPAPSLSLPGPHSVELCLPSSQISALASWTSLHPTFEFTPHQRQAPVEMFWACWQLALLFTTHMAPQTQSLLKFGHTPPTAYTPHAPDAALLCQ